jgi:hypothetical protein
MTIENGTARSGLNAHGRLDDEAKLAFLEALARRRTVKAACDEVGLSRLDAKKGRAADPAFAQLWDEVIEGIADELEAEAMRRALHGYELRTTIRRREKKETRSEDSGNGSQSGESEGEVESVAHKYSEGLLVLLLKANRPEKFGRRVLACEDNIDDEIARDRDPPVLAKGRAA